MYLIIELKTNINRMADTKILIRSNLEKPEPLISNSSNELAFISVMTALYEEILEKKILL
jgi:hypothetical protein